VRVTIPQQPVPFGLPRKPHYTVKDVANVLGISPDLLRWRVYVLIRLNLRECLFRSRLKSAPGRTANQPAVRGLIVGHVPRASNAGRDPLPRRLTA